MSNNFPASVGVKIEDILRIFIFKCHRKLVQKARNKAVGDFSERSDGCVLVATDLLGRGVDISGGIDFVVQENLLKY